MKTAQAPKRKEKKATAAKKSMVKKTSNREKKAIDIQFRTYQASDLQWVVDLTQRELGNIYQTAYQEALAPFQVEQLLTMAQQASIIVCKNEPVGYYTYFSDLSLKRHISSLVIDKSKQRAGIGTHVMRLIEEQAKKDGIQLLEVFIQSTNQPCLAFIQKQGGYQRVQTPYMNTVCFQKVIK